MKYIFLSLFIFFSCLLRSTGQVQWQKAVEGKFPNFWGGSFRDVQQTSDHGYIGAGAIGEGPSDLEYFWAKSDSLGNFLWVQTAIAGHTCIANSIRETSDGGMIICGDCYNSTTTDFYIMVIKTDFNGNEIWSKIIEGPGYDHANSIRQTFDGGYILTGSTSVGTGYSDILIAKLDSNGNIAWSKSFGGTNADVGYSIQQTIDSGFIISGHTASFGGGYDLLLVKTDSVGNISWTKSYSNWFEDYGSAIEQTFDSGYIITGFSGMYAGVFNYSHLIKTDALGDTLWTCTFGGADTVIIHEVKQTTDGGYILTGGVMKDFGQSYICLIKINSAGDTIWTRGYSYPYGAEGNSLIQTNDGGFLIGGYTIGALFIKTDSSGNSLCNQVHHPVETLIRPFTVASQTPVVAIPPIAITGSSYFSGSCDTVLHDYCMLTNLNTPLHYGYPELFVSPNPAKNFLTINLDEGVSTIEIYNILGEIVMTLRGNAGNKVEIQISSLKTGLYFTRTISKNETLFAKFLKE